MRCCEDRGLQYAAALADAGEFGGLGDLGAGKIVWTPKKIAAIEAALREIRRA